MTPRQRTQRRRNFLKRLKRIGGSDAVVCSRTKAEDRNETRCCGRRQSKKIRVAIIKAMEVLGWR